MKSSKCTVCGSTDTFELYPANVEIEKLSFTYVKTPCSGKIFRTVKCKKCTHVFCSPIPKNIYKNYEEVVDKQYLRYTESIKVSARKILPIIKKYRSSGIILDVGCATGEFLEEARNFGYSVEGLELSRWSSDFVKRKGIRVYRERLEQLARKISGRYDVITLFGVIEHFENPIEEMKYISKLLKPGGLLVIWTGDINSLPSKILGKNWWYWQGQHIQYFSHQSLNYLTEHSGFKHIATKIYPFVATYGLLDNSLSRYPMRSVIMKTIRPFFKFKRTWTFYIPGEMLWFGSKIFEK